MTYVKGEDLVRTFENWAPKSLAEDWDKVGLQVGTLNKKIKKLMVTLDVLENVVDEAIEKEVDFIFAHHPLIFHPLEKMLTDSGQSKIIAKCIKHDIAVYSAHTNLDIVNGGINDWLANALELQATEILVPTKTEELFKIAVFVPGSHAEAVRDALGKAGAGFIGKYSHCTFNSEGKGTFKPEEGAKPFIGEKGKLEIVDEVKVETIARKSQLGEIITKMLESHPYEEVAYDIYPLKNEGKKMGLGRIGTLPEGMTLESFARHIKTLFSLDGVRIVGNPSAAIRKVAVIGGDGNDFIQDAVRCGADVLVTGDIKYHIGHDALLHGLNLIDAGHTIEKIMKKGIKDFFCSYLKERGFEKTEVIMSAENTNPFRFI